MGWKDQLHINLLSHTADIQKVLSVAASKCRCTVPRSGAKYVKLIKNIVARNEGSVIEHVTFNYEITGISAAILGHLVRHRIASHTVESQRYVSRDGEYIFPFLDEKKYEDKSTLKILHDYIDRGYELYNWLIDEVKWRKEYARYILSNADTRSLVTTFNLRSLRNLFELRLHESAQLEITYITWRMMLLAHDKCPEVFCDLHDKYKDIF